jgi:glycosyltransferase involved in cell wall biosynthesis
MRISVVSNLPALANVRLPGVEVDFMPYQRYGVTRSVLLRTLWRSRSCDYAVINSSGVDLLIFCLFKLVWPFGRCKVISLDTVLPVPRTESLRDRAGLWLKRVLFKQAHLFIEYFKETEGYERHYGIPRAKFRYVPFKINRYEAVLSTPTSDAGYVFCGGNTRRDFGTLIAAARMLPFPFRIVTMGNAIINENGSTLDDRDLPPNVEVVRHDGSESFLSHIAASRLVALPIRKQNISASGIGVYLASMALGKCVVISEGPAVNGVVPEGSAVIVPAEDPALLAEAIERVYTDDGFRRATAARGQRYALSLKGEERLCESVIDVLAADRGTSGAGLTAAYGR